MNDNIVDEIARKRRLKTLYEGKGCARCGETNLDMIRSYSKIDLHHVASRVIDPDLVVFLCSNCHDWARAQLKELGIVDLSPKPKRNLLEVLAVVLKALGAALKNFGERLIAYGDQLVEFIMQLDVAYPPWRELGAAQL